MEMKTYNVKIKEVGNDHIITTSYKGVADRQAVIDWFGLEEPDVEWYKIEEV